MLWQSWEKQNTPQSTVNSVVTGYPNATVPTVMSSAQATVPLAQPQNEFTVGAEATVTTDTIQARIDANGGDIRSLALLHYQDPQDKKRPFYIFEQNPEHVFVAQTGLIGPDMPTHKALFTLASANYQLAPDQSTLTVPLTWVDPKTGLKVNKIYTFYRDSYKIDVTYQIVNSGNRSIPIDAYFQLLRDGKSPIGESKFVHTFTGPALYTAAGKFIKLDFKKLDKGEQSYPKHADNGWIGMVQHHFVSVWLPPNGGKREFYAKAIGNSQYSAGVILPEGTLAPLSTLSFTVPLYVGPQIQKTLTALAPGLDYVVDYGWLTPIAAPIFWVLQHIHGLVGNWGWSIVILTILIKLLFFPLSAKSYKSMAQMRGLAPKLQRLKELYGDDKQKLHQSMMDLYKSEKVNPLGGCLPVVVQIPVFIALYWTLLGSVEMRQAPFMGWIQDLSAPDPYYILPIVMGLTMLLQTKLNPAPPDPMQAKVMMIMPLAFSVFFLFFPAGLVLYWVVNNIMSISQQWVITRKYEATQVGHAKP